MVDSLGIAKNEMQRSLRRITSAFCRRFVLFHECSADGLHARRERHSADRGEAISEFSLIRPRLLSFSLPSFLFPSARWIIRLCRCQYYTDYMSSGSPMDLRAISIFTYIYFVSLWNFRQRNFFFSCIHRILAFSWLAALFKISYIHGRTAQVERKIFEEFVNDLRAGSLQFFPALNFVVRKPRIKLLHCDVKSGPK